MSPLSVSYRVGHFPPTDVVPSLRSFIPLLLGRYSQFVRLSAESSKISHHYVSNLKQPCSLTQRLLLPSRTRNSSVIDHFRERRQLWVRARPRSFRNHTHSLPTSESVFRTVNSSSVSVPFNGSLTTRPSGIP